MVVEGEKESIGLTLVPPQRRSSSSKVSSRSTMASSSRSRATASMRSTVASCLSILSIAAAAVIGVDGAPAFGSSKLLVVLDAKDSPREHYSSFWNSLEGTLNALSILLSTLQQS